MDLLTIVEEEEEEEEGGLKMRTKPALPCSHTSLKTHQSTGIRRAEIQNREKEEARTKPSKAKPSPKSRRPQVTSSPRYLAPAQTLLLSMMTMHGEVMLVMMAMFRDEKCPFLCQSLVPLTSLLVLLVPLTLAPLVPLVPH